MQLMPLRRGSTAVLLAALSAVAVVAPGCSTPRRSAAPPAPTKQVTRGPQGSQILPIPVSAATTRRPPTTEPAAPPRPVLPAPRALQPVVSPANPGEGRWQPAGDKLAGGYAVYTTQLRPAAGLQPAGVAWVDSAASRIALYAGFGQPYGSWPDQGLCCVGRRFSTARLSG